MIVLTEEQVRRAINRSLQPALAREVVSIEILTVLLNEALLTAPVAPPPHAILNKDHFPALCPACQPPVQERESDDAAPPNSLPSWQECQRIIKNQEFRERARAGLEVGVLDLPPTTPEPTEIHRFIYEYDDADRYKSAWFMHRLELALATAAKQAREGALAVGSTFYDMSCGSCRARKEAIEAAAQPEQQKEKNEK